MNYISVIVSTLEGKNVGYKQLKQLESNQENEELLTVVYTGIYTLLRCALKQPPSSLKTEVSLYSKNSDKCLFITVERDPSWGGPIELFLVPASAPQLV